MNTYTSMSAASGQEEQKYTIFVVDDSFDDRTLARKSLSASPHVYNVHCFESGDKLMEHFAAHDFYSSPVMRNMPLLILLDCHMPGTNGLGILDTLRKHPMTKDIPVVMLTSDTSRATAEEAHRLRVNAFLPKPLQLDSVHNVIFNSRSWPRRHAGAPAEN